MKKELSKIFSLNWWDIVKGIILFFLTNIGDLVYQALEMWLSDTSRPIDWKEMLKVSIVATVMYIIKNFFTGKKKEDTDVYKQTP